MSPPVQERKSFAPPEVRELSSAVSEQSRIVEDFVRDAEERFAELTRRVASVEERSRNPGQMVVQASGRDTGFANAVNELRARHSESTAAVANLRDELNKWESEINDRFLNLEKALGRSVPVTIDNRLSEIERKTKALDTSMDGFESMISEISGRVDSVYSKATAIERIDELQKRMQSDSFSAADATRRLQALELRLAGLELTMKAISQKVIMVGPRVIE
jgi:chromosome segregation ATPase